MKSYAWVLALLLPLAMAACSSTPDEDASAGMQSDGTGGLGQAPVGGVDSSQFGSSTATPGTQAHLQDTVGDTIQFGYDRSDLSPEARQILDSQALWMQQFSNLTFTIEGHADERGTREYNLALGERRAAAVRNYLTALGISPARLSIVSFGKERPVSLGSDESSWAANRRAVTAIN